MINGYEVHLEIKGNRRILIQQYVANNQREYDGKSFYGLMYDGTIYKVKLVGKDYGLSTTGVGEIIVRPLYRVGNIRDMVTK